MRKDDLVAFEWRAALGDSPVTEAELIALAASKAPLVQFRGEWVHVDLEALRRSARFLRTRGSGRASVLDVLGALGVAGTCPPPSPGSRPAGSSGTSSPATPPGGCRSCPTRRGCGRSCAPTSGGG